MSVIQWNCRGYKSRYGDITRILRQSNPACLCIQESMLGLRTPTSPRGYCTYYYSVRPDPAPGDGLVTLIHNSVPHSHIALNTTLQALAYKIRLSREYTICNIYLNPRGNVTANNITDLINQLPRPYIVMGDFNAKHEMWGCDSTDERGKIIENIISTTDACILNTGEPTHFSVATASLSAIDLTLCSPCVVGELQWSVKDDLCGSDHFPIIIEEIIPVANKREQKFNISRANWPLFEDLTVTYVQDIIDENMTVDNLVAVFNGIIIDAAHSAIPKTSDKVHSNRIPWWKKECWNVDQERKRTLRVYQRTKLVCDKIAYSRARAIAQNSKDRLRKQSWQKYVSKINKDTPMSQVWDRFRKMKGIYRDHSEPCLMHQGQLIMDPDGVADLLAKHYANISSSDNYSAKFRQTKNLKESKALNFTTRKALPYNSEITLTEINSMLQQSKQTAAGEDEIHYKMIQKAHPSCRDLLNHIYNRVWTEESFPAIWRRATVLSFLKPGKPKTDSMSYRPIALTSCVGKLLEKIVNVRLTRQLESENMFPAHQYGHRKYFSTTEALTRLSTDISVALSLKEQLVCVFFDLTKAYDTTWNCGILVALHECGIRGHLAVYVQNFLNNRIFKTKVGNVHSTDHIQEEGVPQGSVMSCTLFSLAINGITKVLPPNVKYSLYVDDLVIYTSSNYLPAIERRLQIAIDRAESWTAANGFNFSTEKTFATHFHKKRGLPTEPSLHLKNNPIVFKRTAKFLGMTFDQKLTWKDHIKLLKCSCMKSLNILKAVSNQTWGADRTMMLRLYRALIRSKLDYGSSIYATAKPQILNTLNPVHNSALRLCTGAFRSSPVISIYAESGEKPLELRRMQLAIQYYARIMQLPQSPISRCLRDSAQTPSTVGHYIEQMKTELKMPHIEIMPAKYSNYPTWQIPTTTFCDSFLQEKKTNVNPENIKIMFFDHLEELHHDCEHIYTDGSKSEFKVGMATIYKQRKITSRLRAETTIFTAELLAILKSMPIISKSRKDKFTIFSDSRSSIQAIMKYNNNHPIVTEINNWLIRLAARHKSVKLCWIPSHVGIRGNELADKAANEAANVDDHNSHMPIPHRDYYAHIKLAVQDHWREQWISVDTDNKLRNIKDDIAPWPSACQTKRPNEILLTRLRIGHTRLTHGYLMEGSRQPPYCEDCLVPLTVKHILAECPSLSEERRRAYPNLQHDDGPNKILKEMICQKPRKNFNIDPLIQFLDRCGILKKI